MKQYNIIGMSCAACSARIEKAVKTVSGVNACTVNLLTNSMTVDGTAAPETVISAVREAGYDANLKTADEKPEPKKSSELTALIRRFACSLVFLIALMYITVGHTMLGFGIGILENYPTATAFCELVLTTAVMIINRKFFVNGFRGVLHRAPNMDTLVSVGAGSAFIYSIAVMIKMLADKQDRLHDLYFESAAMILTLITLGKLLECYSKGKTTNALKGLMSLAPETAITERDGREVTVPVSDIRVGDVFLLRPGSRVPVDGIVTDGACFTDESALTGESMPVDKKPNDRVYVATTNMSGYARCKATHVGKDTALAKIIQTVSDAAATKAPISRTADKVSAVFVPVVMIISLVTALAWLIAGYDFGYCLARAISVLVISCPCALGLATPVAVMVSSGVGAKNGILFKTATSIEYAGKIKTAVFDKTGTITNGTPEITDVISDDKTELMRVARSLEEKSEHPIARAIVKYDVNTYPVTDFVNKPGGVTARYGDSILTCGNLAFVSDYAKIPEKLKAQAEALSDKGKTAVYVAKDREPLGVIAVADTVKRGSHEAISELNRMGIETVMLTGDNERTARAIADTVGITTVIAGVMPTDKQKTVQKYKQNGITAMIGDGINDAPALTTADVGIAIGAGTDIAADSADIVLVNSTLTDVVTAVKLSRKALKTIRENLFWAFVYNVIGIPVAAGVLIPFFGIGLSPMFAAAAMSLSSFCVVTNALRINLFKTKKGVKKMKKEYNVEGMMCPKCEAHVKTALEKIDGIASVTASHTENKVTVTLTKDVPEILIKSTIENEGYKVN